VAELRAAGADVAVHDPLYTDDELSHYGFQAFHLGDTADGAIVQTDHSSYAALQDHDLPGIRVIVDGRNILSHQLNSSVNVITIGAPAPTSLPM